GNDTLTGGAQADQFVYAGSVAGTLDEITDFSIRQDRFGFGGELGLDSIRFQNGAVDTLSGDSNVLVLQGGFANAGAAAQAIADNDGVTSETGVFVYFNVNLGISRLVHSQDLGGGGEINVLANLTNQAGEQGLVNLSEFTSANFSLV
ncbi:MAG: hypothetical protein AAF289_15710, partial [Cyanobacteria bacterium P01_A01_bin.135]